MGRAAKHLTLADKTAAQRASRRKWDGRAQRAARKKTKPLLLKGGPTISKELESLAEFDLPEHHPLFALALNQRVDGIFPYDIAPPYHHTYFRDAPLQRPFSNVHELEALVHGRLLNQEAEREEERRSEYRRGCAKAMRAWATESVGAIAVFESLCRLEDKAEGNEYVDAMVRLHCRWTARIVWRLHTLAFLNP
uniref:Uncharacterized protein n=1 Tax=Mycena chlorophos TaxID=658473 RepID=A0ABQ0KXT7_MYCCL|nr:predicted protein [Mycena chlorophos]